MLSNTREESLSDYWAVPMANRREFRRDVRVAILKAAR